MRTMTTLTATFLALTMMNSVQAQSPAVPPGDAATTMREAGREASQAADAAREAARLALRASKASVKGASQQSSDLIGKLTTDAEAAATRAEIKIADANRAMGVKANASMQRAADSAGKSVEATRVAMQKSKDAAEASLSSNVASVRRAASGARAAIVRAATAASNAAKAAREAARTTWERDNAQTQLRG
jgi:hypothetical protein